MANRRRGSPAFPFEADIRAIELPQTVRDMAIHVLSEGLELGEDRRHWQIDVRDEAGDVLMSLTLAEAAGGEGRVNRH